MVWPSGRGRASAVAVSAGRIIAIGTDEEILASAHKGARIVEAAGGTILPAFHDAHVHFLMASRSLGELDLFGAETQADVKRRISDFAAARPDDPWILGRGWLYSAFPGGMPSIDLLDRLLPDRPAYLQSYDAHTAWVNSRALAAAGLDRRAPSSSPRGILKEAAMQGVARKLPARTPGADLDALRAGLRVAAARGVAGVQEAGHGLSQLELYDALEADDQLTLRVRLAFDMEPGLDMNAWNHRLDMYEEARRSASGASRISTGILKAFADGVVESRTAALLEPYEGVGADEAGARGAPNWEAGELTAAVRVADARGWQVQVHAIGDAAIRQALDAFEGTDRGRRHRIEHVEAPARVDIPRFADLGVIASMQPAHAEPGHNMLGIWAANLGPDRAANAFPWASILRAGGRLALGTDWPVVPLDPVFSLHVAVNRQTAGGDPAGGWLPEERLSLAQAVDGWTSGSAYAAHAEGSRGSLREGMLADIAVLDRDLAATPAADIGSTSVVATVVGGRVVFEA